MKITRVCRFFNYVGVFARFDEWCWKAQHLWRGGQKGNKKNSNLLWYKPKLVSHPTSVNWFCSFCSLLLLYKKRINLWTSSFISEQRIIIACLHLAISLTLFFLVLFLWISSRVNLQCSAVSHTAHARNQYNRFLTG